MQSAAAILALVGTKHNKIVIARSEATKQSFDSVSAVGILQMDCFRLSASQ